MNQQAKYLNNTVWCRMGVSPIHGVGVFAVRDIPKGTCFTEYKMFNKRAFNLKEEDFKEIIKEIRDLIFDQMLWVKGTKLYEFHSPNLSVNIQSFLNHSNTPNTDGNNTLVDIKKGEELTEDYFSLHPEGLCNISIKHYERIK